MHQVFISYRRDGGEALAQLLFDRLSALGFSVFYDIESLTSGKFDTKIYSMIEECPDFIIVLPPSALDRCVFDEDWVRCEIRHALNHNKNIVPVMMRGFVFPKDLPADISAIATENGVAFDSMEYLEARIDKIVSLLVSTPSDTQANCKSTKNIISSKPPVVINRVCSVASNEPDNAFPEGNASSSINIDNFSVVQFKATVSNIPQGARNIKYDIKIYHKQNGLVYHDTALLDWHEEWDTLSLGWIIKGSSEDRVALGDYTAEFKVDDSNTYFYSFEIVSKSRSKGLFSRLFKKG